MSALLLDMKKVLDGKAAQDQCAVFSLLKIKIVSFFMICSKGSRPASIMYDSQR